MQVQCPKCKQALQVPESAAGKMIRCPKCNQTLALPATASSTPALAKPAALPVPPAPTVAPPAPPPVSPAAPPVRAAPAAVEEHILDIIEDDEPAGADGLGRLVKEYKPRKWWIGLAVFTVLFLINVPCTVAAFWINDKSKPLIAAAMIPNMIFLLGMLICGTFTLLSVKRRILLHERGLAMYSLFRSAKVRWTEVTAVYLVKTGMFVSTNILLDLEGRDQLDLPSIVRENDELAERIVAATAPMIKAKIEHALDHGELVSFGPFLSMGPKGLQFRPNGAKGEVLKLRWKEIKSFSLGRSQTNPGATGLAAAASVQTQFHISSENQSPWTCATGNVANLAVFLELVEKRSGVKLARG